jgi:hypothetical protein
MNQPHKPEEAASQRVSELLKQLQVQPDAAKVTLQGRAVSRSETSLHLAVATGVVAVPLGEIEDVAPLGPAGDPTLVSVLVRDNTKVRHLLKVQPTTGVAQGTGCQPAGAQAPFARGQAFLPGGGGLNLPPIFRCDSFTNDTFDTPTVSLGVFDQTDDVIPLLQCDDINT